jgi:hypothetical protein
MPLWQYINIRKMDEAIKNGNSATLASLGTKDI